MCSSLDHEQEATNNFRLESVKEITETKDIIFRYVETSQNPADLAGAPNGKF